jgi:hypothetical protein
MKRDKLIKSLKLAINALKNDTIHYEWHSQCSCNCGVVSQAVLGLSSLEVRKRISPLITAINKKVEQYKALKKTPPDRTWKNIVKFNCSITGKTNVQILSDLFDAGLTPEDICHLEFLENPAILKRSGIPRTGIITEKVKTGTKQTIVKKGWFKKQVVTEDVFEQKTRNVENYLEPNYYSQKENLIKYLVAWVSILEEETRPISEKSEKLDLHEELLKEISNENYEKAAEIRDLIAVKQ